MNLLRFYLHTTHWNLFGTNLSVNKRNNHIDRKIIYVLTNFICTLKVN